MSSKTKILVLKSRHLIWTCVIFVLLVLFIVLLATVLGSDKTKKQLPLKSGTSAVSSSADVYDTSLNTSYIPGCYAASVTLGENEVNILVYVDKNKISSIRIKNLAQSVATLYPMVPSVFDSLCSQILTSQNINGVTYSDSTQYTAELLLNAIARALSQAYAK